MNPLAKQSIDHCHHDQSQQSQIKTGIRTGMIKDEIRFI